MTWQDRILTRGAYTSPSGVRMEFDYEDVSRSTALRTASFDFTGVNGTYVQSNGHSGRVYPLRCIFSGDDCDLEAQRFENALAEGGEGRLEHPMYGTFNAVPTGEIERTDKLKTGANEATVDVTFVDALGTVYPDATQDAAADIGALADAYQVAIAEEFGDVVDVSTVAGREVLKARVVSQVDAARAAILPALAAFAEARAQVEDALDTITRNAATLAAAPSSLAEAVVSAFQTAAMAGAGVRDLLVALVGLVTSSQTQPLATPTDYVPDGGAIPASSATAASNAFHAARLFSSAALAGACRNAALGSYLARPAAVSAAVGLLDQWDALVVWQDAGWETLEQIDTGGTYQATQTLVALSAGYLIQRSFLLAAERRITLTRPRTVIDLAAELYREVDAQLDRMIDDNDLTGDELVELPAGKVVVYYA